MMRVKLIGERNTKGELNSGLLFFIYLITKVFIVIKYKRAIKEL